jgi:nitroreductase
MRSNDPRVFPWQIRPEEFPWEAPLDRQLVFLIRYAILAPSSHNTQPWRFFVEGNEVRVHADPQRLLLVADLDGREAHIAIGAAIENLLIAAESFGFRATLVYGRGGASEPVATVRLTKSGETPSQRHDLFRAIPHRRTCRIACDGRAVPADVLEHIAASVRDLEGVQLWLTERAEDRKAFHDLVVEADARQFADSAYREELAFWMGEGAFGAPWLLAKLEQLAVAHINVGPAVVRSDGRLLMSSPVLGLLFAAENDRPAQLRVGQAYERIALLATHLGLGTQPLGQVLAVPETRDKMARAAPTHLGVPVLPMRLGYAPAEAHRTPRRAIEEVLM